SASGSAVKGLSQVLLGVAGDQVEDGSDVGRRGLGVQKGELQVVPPGDLGARDDGVPGGEQRFAGVEVGPVDLGRVGDGGRDVAADVGGQRGFDDHVVARVGVEQPPALGGQVADLVEEGADAVGAHQPQRHPQLVRVVAAGGLQGLVDLVGDPQP